MRLKISLIAVGRRFESYMWPSFCKFEAYLYFFIFNLLELLLVVFSQVFAKRSFTSLFILA